MEGFLRSRRKVLEGALGLAALGAAGAGRLFAQQQPPPPVTKGTQLVLLGTRAGPGVDLKRAETGTAIIVDGTPYLVDCGYGVVRNLVAANINGQKIEKIVFTHLHNDHTADIP